MSDFPLPEAFLVRMRQQLKTEQSFQAFLSAYERPTCKGIRVNTLKISPEAFQKITPFTLTPVSWEPNGFCISEDKAGRHAHHFAGLYYSQEPSAMSVVPLLNVQEGDRVLDLCAAPGGKSTQIAQALKGRGILVSNEIVGSRAKILSQNIERLGVTNAVVTNAAPAELAKRFQGYFDKILVDAPCSGEGMFKKNQQEALENWSEQNVLLCAERQREILHSAAQMLSVGGRLVYSTCTFAEEEDEAQISAFLTEHSEFTLLEQKKLYPHEVEGEGHFYAVLQKNTGEERKELPLLKSNLSQKELSLFTSFCQTSLRQTPSGTPYKVGDTLYLLPEGMFAVDKLSILRAGVRAGEFKKDRFTPAHALAVSLKQEDAQRSVSLTVSESENYLRGNTFNADIANGWCLVCVDHFPLGWGKAVNGLVKNHFPKGLWLLK